MDSKLRVTGLVHAGSVPTPTSILRFCASSSLPVLCSNTALLSQFDTGAGHGFESRPPRQGYDSYLFRQLEHQASNLGASVNSRVRALEMAPPLPRICI